MIGLLILVVETAAFLVGLVLRANFLVLPPLRIERYADYLANRDELLGWPEPAAIGHGEFDRSGSRRVPAYPDPLLPSCVALFGDSFTWGAEVAPEETWGNALAHRLGCRVANYGVPGYGTDQALLRFRDRIADPAPVVVLAHFTEDIVRNVNQFRLFLGARNFGFKPRFVLDDDQLLQLVPAPAIAAADLPDLYRRTKTLLPHEYFLPGTWGGPVVLQPPYSYAMLKMFAHYRVQARLRGVGSFMPFYAPDHPAGGLQVTRAIVQEFGRIARARGQRPLVVVLPDDKDFRAAARGKALDYEMLLASGPDTPPIRDMTQPLLQRLGGRDLCTLFTSCSGGAHYSAKGNALLAAEMAEWLAEQQEAWWAIEAVARAAPGAGLPP